MKPMILAPAGCRSSFFAALAGDADGIYCGLKEFSARIKADNFTVDELVPLTELAHEKEKKVFITMNSLLKDKECDYAGKLIKMLEKYVKPERSGVFQRASSFHISLGLFQNGFKDCEIFGDQNGRPAAGA